MQPKSFISLLGFILLIAGTFSPLISPFGLIKWNLFDLNQVFGIIILLVAVIGILAAMMQQIKLVKVAAWIGLGLVVLLLVAAVFKVNTSFSFIPFKKAGAFLSGKISYRWGWYLLFAGPIIAWIGTIAKKSPVKDLS